MSLVKVIPIGSSSSGNCIYININDVGFIVDAGIGIRRVNNAIKDNNVNAIFITHTHSDHIGQLNALRKHYNTLVYSSDDTSLVINSDVILDYYLKTDIVNGLKVVMFKTHHDCFGSSGFIFEKDNVRFGYVTDTGMISEDILHLLKNCQIVLIESNHDLDMLKNGPYPIALQNRINSNGGHLSNIQCSEAVRFLNENNTKYFFLGHLSVENNKPEIAYNESKSLIKDNGLIYVLPQYGGDIKYINIEDETINEVEGEEYNYCLVAIGKGKYWYLDNGKKHIIDDEVIIPFGKNNKEKQGIIINVVTYKESELPYPLSKMKCIVNKEK